MDQFSEPHLPATSPAPVAFAGDRGVFRHLVTRGALLELVTVGFYRFWLATDMRRHLWSSTVIDSDELEYSGRAKELLIGFLFALAILAPFYLLYFLAGLEAERFKAFGSTPLFVVLYLFGQFAIYRARRYRLTRTTWRGVRFWMSGSGWKYAMYAALWGILVGLTLGLALPWRDASLERYKMSHTYYGDLQASFEGRGGEFFKRGWWLWLLAFPSYFLAFIPLPFIYAVFKAIEWRWWLEGIRFGGLSLESRLAKSDLIDLYWKVIGWIVLFALVFAGYVAFAAFMTASMNGQTILELFRSRNIVGLATFGGIALVGYLAFIMAANVVMRVYLIRDIWQRVVQSVTIHGIEVTANVTAKGELANALGEGFADGFDVAGF